MKFIPRFLIRLFNPKWKTINQLSNQLISIRSKEANHIQYSPPGANVKYYNYLNNSATNPYVYVWDKEHAWKLIDRKGYDFYINFLTKARNDLINILENDIDLSEIKSEIRDEKINKIL